MTAAALVVAPALFLGDNLLHPREFPRGRANEAAQLHEIAGNYTRWQVAHLLGFLAIVTFAAGVLGLAFLVHEVQNSGWAWQYYAPALMFAVALVLLGLTAARVHAVARWAAGLLVAGALVSGTEGVVVSHAYFVAGAALLLAGSGAVGVQLARMTDEEFGAREGFLWL